MRRPVSLTDADALPYQLSMAPWYPAARPTSSAEIRADYVPAGRRRDIILRRRRLSSRRAAEADDGDEYLPFAHRLVPLLDAAA